MLVTRDILSGGNPEGYLILVRNDNNITSSILYFFNNYIKYFRYAIYIGLIVKTYMNKDNKLLKFITTFLIWHLIMTLIVVQVGKHVIGSPRPISGCAERRWLTSDDMFHSMPSGHTTEAAVSCSCLAQLGDGQTATLFWGIVPALVGLARIFVGMHHSLDVLAGSLLGTLSGVVVIYRTNRLNQRPAAGEEENAAVGPEEEAVAYDYMRYIRQEDNNLQ
jgi:undecaprenyl-diphosphatase